MDRLSGRRTWKMQDDEGVGAGDEHGKRHDEPEENDDHRSQEEPEQGGFLARRAPVALEGGAVDDHAGPLPDAFGSHDLGDRRRARNRPRCGMLPRHRGRRSPAAAYAVKQRCRRWISASHRRCGACRDPPAPAGCSHRHSDSCSPGSRATEPCRAGPRRPPLRPRDRPGRSGAW